MKCDFWIKEQIHLTVFSTMRVMSLIIDLEIGEEGIIRLFTLYVVHSDVESALVSHWFLTSHPLFPLVARWIVALKFGWLVANLQGGVTYTLFPTSSSLSVVHETTLNLSSILSPVSKDGNLAEAINILKVSEVWEIPLCNENKFMALKISNQIIQFT